MSQTKLKRGITPFLILRTLFSLKTRFLEDDDIIQMENDNVAVFSKNRLKDSRAFRDGLKSAHELVSIAQKKGQ